MKILQEFLKKLFVKNDNCSCDNTFRGGAKASDNAGFSDFRLGFTLVEVLITLAIIGIIAAITLPTINKHIKQQQASSALPKMYSDLRNAARMYQADHGIDIEDFDTSLSAKEFLDTYFIPYFKGATPCPNNGKDCWVGGKTPRNINRSKKITVGYGYRLNDGKILAVQKASDCGMLFFVDVDGVKGDNYSGRDIFNFYLINMSKNTITTGWTYTHVLKYAKSGIYPGGIGSNYFPMTGYTLEQLMVKNSSNGIVPLDRACDKTISSEGYMGNACAVVLFQNNWKFPKNYPW